MNVTYEKKNKMTFIGYHTEIKPEEAYRSEIYEALADDAA